MYPETEHHELPADLQQLADQLSREAHALAREYPADMPHAAPLAPLAEADATPRGWLPWLLGGGIAASVAVALAFAANGVYTPAADAQLAIEAAIVVPAAVALEAAEPNHQPMPVYPVGIGLPSRNVPGALKAAPGLSAPEWEAVLDLTPAEDWEGLELSL